MRAELFWAGAKNSETASLYFIVKIFSLPLYKLKNTPLWGVF
jgi:hypothetical protein